MFKWKCVVHQGPADAFRIPRNKLSALERRAQMFMRPLQTTFNVVIWTFSGEESLKYEKKKQKI